MDDIANKIIELVKEMLTDGFKGDSFINQCVDFDNIDLGVELNEILSSIGMISLIVELEKYYDIEIADEEIISFNCINDLAAIIHQKK